MSRADAANPSSATFAGRVCASAGRTAVVRLDREDCGACPLSPTCGSLAGDGGATEVEASNPIGAVVGDRVAVEVRASARVIAAVILFLVPVVAAIGGAVAGARIGPDLLGWSADASAAAGLGLATLASLGGVAAFRGRFAASGRFTPVVTAILPSGAAGPSRPASSGGAPVVLPKPARSIGA